MQDCQELKTLFNNKLYFACIPKRRTLVNKNNKIIETKCSIISQCLKTNSKYCLLISFKESSTLGEIDYDFIREKHKLTKREMHIVQLIVHGYTNKQIAKDLFLSHFTVANHLKHIYAKTKVKSRTELANLLVFLPHLTHRL